MRLLLLLRVSSVPDTVLFLWGLTEPNYHLVVVTGLFPGDRGGHGGREVSCPKLVKNGARIRSQVWLCGFGQVAAILWKRLPLPHRMVVRMKAKGDHVWVSAQ